MITFLIFFAIVSQNRPPRKQFFQKINEMLPQGIAQTCFF